jgi:tetratricopeptide (TPR) repeat protein
MILQDFETRLSQRPFSPLFARCAGEYLASGRVAEAKELCTAGLERYPSYSTAQLILGYCFAVEGNYVAAMEQLHHALQLHPQSPILRKLHDEWSVHVTIGPSSSVEIFPKIEVALDLKEQVGPSEQVTGVGKGDVEDIPDDGRIVSKTLAEIYAAQGEFGEAITTYQLLKLKKPERSPEFDVRIAELEARLRERLQQQ